MTETTTKAIFDELVAKTSFVSGKAMGASAGATLLLRASRIEALRQLLFLEVIEESAVLPDGTRYQFSFHIPIGQFHFEAPLRRDGPTPSIDLTQVTLQRIQRRDNFRAPTDVLNVGFRLRTPFASGGVVSQWHVLDLSVGGFSFALPASDAPSVKLGQHLDGTLIMPGRSDLKVKAVVRHINAMEIGTDQVAGVEILEMNQDLQRELLSMGLQIHRETKNRR